MIQLKTKVTKAPSQRDVNQIAALVFQLQRIKGAKFKKFYHSHRKTGVMKKLLH